MSDAELPHRDGLSSIMSPMSPPWLDKFLYAGNALFAEQFARRVLLEPRHDPPAWVRRWVARVLPSWTRQAILDQNVFDRGGQLFSIVAMTIVGLVTWYRVQRDWIPPDTPPVVVPALLVLAALIVYATVEAIVRPGSRVGSRLFCLYALAFTLAHVPVMLDPTPPTNPPLLVDIAITSLILSPFAFGARWGTISCLYFGVWYGVLRSHAIGLAMGLTSASIWVVVGLSVVAFVSLSVSITSEVQATSERGWALRETLARSGARRFEQMRWNGLIHDKILGALRLAAREPELSENSGELARQALEVLRDSDDGTPSRTFQGAVREHARRLGLQVIITVTGDIPDNIGGQTLVDATAEALTNVARHSGQRVAFVTATVVDDHVRVEIRDHGQGFNPHSTQERAGIPLGILARMRSIGGQAEVTSKPGSGTTVTLHWEAAEVPEVPYVRWDMFKMFPVTYLVTLLMLLHFAAGWLAGGVLSPQVLAATMLSCTALTVATGVIPPTTRAWFSLACAIALMPVAHLTNLTGPVPLDWRYWWGGAYAPALASLAFFTRPLAGWVAFGMMVAVEAVTRIALGWWSASGLLWNYVVTLGYVTLAGLVRIGLDLSADAINRSAARAGRLRLRLVEQQEQDAAASERSGTLLDEVGPMLQRIGAGGVLTADERTAMTLMEARLRDRLVAGPLVTDVIEASTDAARRRGARVELSAEQTPEPIELEHLTELMCTILDAVGPRTHVAVQWRPRGRRRGSITVVGSVSDAAAAELGRLADEPDQAFAVDVSRDDDSMLVDLAQRPSAVAQR